MELIQIILTLIIGIIGLLPDKFSKKDDAQKKGYRTRFILITIAALALITNGIIEINKKKKAESAKIEAENRLTQKNLFENEAFNLISKITSTLAILQADYSAVETMEETIESLNDDKKSMDQSAIFEELNNNILEQIDEAKRLLTIAQKSIKEYDEDHKKQGIFDRFFEITNDFNKEKILLLYRRFKALIKEDCYKNQVELGKIQSEIYHLFSESYRDTYAKIGINK